MIYIFSFYALPVTERSESVVSHVDAISGYNARLSTLIESEKSKDDMMRTLEKQLHADKLKVGGRVGGCVHSFIHAFIRSFIQVHSIKNTLRSIPSFFHFIHLYYFSTRT
jgi:hypothetical protein